MTAPVRIMIIDDAPNVRQGLKALLTTAPDIEIVAAERHAAQTVPIAAALHPDIIILDAARKGRFQLLPALRQQCPHAQILILTSRAEAEDVNYAIAEGVRGFLLKEALSTDLVTAVRDIFQGKTVFHPVLLSYLPPFSKPA